jgi:ATP-dependent DNA helicase RecQ
MTEKIHAILKNVFGYDAFRPFQAEIIGNILAKKDVLVVMPTGGGKSLCYQIPALVFDGLTIVISPLISLMKDQVAQLTQAGVPAAVLNSSLSPVEYRNNVRQIKQKKAKLLYLAPEALLKPNMLELLSSVKVECLAIDEAHCISQWGHDFRPEYRQLIKARSSFPKAVCAALTATATPRVREDIKASLQMDGGCEFVASFNRENLFIQFVPKDNPIRQALQFIQKFEDQSGIIYCHSRKQVENLHEIISDNGFSAAPYHAGLSDIERNRNQEAFIRDDVQIIVATIAFGMGIDKPNVRFVVHFDLPKNIESYYQEIGRAGRDGLRSHCLLLFSYADVQKIKYFIDQKEPAEKRVANIHLSALLRFAETEICRRIPLLNYFGEDYTIDKCHMCDNCLAEEKEKVDLTVAAQKFLSCVKRTGEKFGSLHIIDVLRGSKASKVMQFGHQKLSTYGIGQEYSKKQWQQMFRQFLHQGLMAQDMEFGGLKVTDKGWHVLKGSLKVQGQPAQEQAVDRLVEESHRVEDLEIHQPLFELLRKERKKLADASGVPPYVIFSDKTLLEMATFFPGSKDSLLDIHGVGTVKCAKFGATFLKIIDRYCRENEIQERPRRTRKSLAGSPAKSAPVKSDKPRYMHVGDIFNTGRSVRDIMEIFNIKQSTVIEHLTKYVMEGFALRSDEIFVLSTLPSDQKNVVLKAFDKCGSEYLKPAFDALNAAVSYDDLKILRLHHLARQKAAEESIPSDRAKVPCLKDIICLANSRKYAGHCIAGKEIADNQVGNWIRPVSSRDCGELSPNDIIMQNGKIPALLDIITVPLNKHCPQFCQTENFDIDGSRRWIQKGAFPNSEVSRLCDEADHLWINGYHSYQGLNDRVPLNQADLDLSSSLLFIKPDRLTFIVAENSKLLKKVRAKFDYRGETYCLTVTDPLVENQYLKVNMGEYPVDNNIAYLCVSIGEPHEGYRYKLVAGVVLIYRYSSLKVALK